MVTTQRIRYVVLVPIIGLALGVGGPAGAALPGTTVGGKRHTCTVVGTSGNDRLSGTSRNDVICGLGGNDVIVGGAGNDIIDGGTGNDTITAGAGNDTIGGGSGNDTITAGTGNDIAGGGEGRDTVQADAGNDTVSGGPGDDRIDPGAGNDTATGDYGNDWIDGGWGNDWIDGGNGADDVEGGTGVNTCRRDAADVSPATSCMDLETPVLFADTAELVGITSYEFDPQKTLQIRMRLTDDRSGIHSAWIRIGVEGAQTPITLQLSRLMSGTANDGVWQFSANVPKWGPVGEYRILDAGAEDWAMHRTTVAGSADFPSFTVTGEHDKELPVLDQASLEWLTPTTFTNTADQPQRLQVHLTDDVSGILETIATVVASNGRQETWRDSRLTSGTTRDGTWEISGTIPAYLPPGEWRLNTVRVRDRAGHDRYVSPDDATIAPLVVTGDTFDTDDPAAVVSSIRWLPPTQKADARFQRPHLSIRLTDDLAGIQRCLINLATTANPEDLYTLGSAKLISGSLTNGTWDIHGSVPAAGPPAPSSSANWNCTTASATPPTSTCPHPAPPADIVNQAPSPTYEQDRSFSCGSEVPPCSSAAGIQHQLIARRRRRPASLLAAVTVAASSQAQDLGVLVVVADEMVMTALVWPLSPHDLTGWSSPDSASATSRRHGCRPSLRSPPESRSSWPPLTRRNAAAHFAKAPPDLQKR